MTHNHIKPVGKCQWLGCTKDATEFASNVGEILPGFDTTEQKLAAGTFGFYCEEHAFLMANKGNPEYHVHCPYCACKFGVN